MKRKLYLGFLMLFFVVLNSKVANAQIPLGGSGSSQDPFLIQNYDDLKLLSSNQDLWSKKYHFKQTADINANSTQNEAFTPIGNVSKAFRGTYDGNGNKILNIYINEPNADFIGLFGNMNGKVLNLEISVDITGKDIVGGLCGRSIWGDVTNCQVSGSILGHSYVGGLIGKYDIGNIESCISSAMVEGYEVVGGLIGLSDGVSVKKCVTSGSVKCEYIYAGGIIAYSLDSDINYCKSTATVEAYNACGGINGYQLRGTILNSYSDGIIISTMGIAGGLVGGLKGNLDPQNYQLDDFYVKNSFSKSIVNDNYGGLIGRLLALTDYIQFSYWDKTVSLGETLTAGQGEETPFFMLMQQNEGNWPWATDNTSGNETTPWISIPGRYPYLFFEDPQPVLYAVWTGEYNNDWFDARNWNTGEVPNLYGYSGVEPVPSYLGNVIIPPTDNYPHIMGGQITLDNMMILDDAFMKFWSDYNWSATNSPSFIINDEVSGDVKFERDLSTNKIHYISSPLDMSNVSFANITTFSGYSGMGLSTAQYEDGNYDMFYKMVDPDWVTILHTDAFGNETFENSLGYLYYKHDGAIDAVVFEGEPYNDDYTVSTNYSNAPNASGYNLLGNPYLSSIAMNTDADEANNFISNNEGNFAENCVAVFIWNPDANEGLGDFQIISNVPDETQTASGFLMPSQGFIVKTAADGVEFSFDKDIRKHFDSEARFYKKGNANSDVVVKLSGENGSISTTRIVLNDLAKSGIDELLDISHLYSSQEGFNRNMDQVYSKVAGSNVAFAIQSIPSNLSTVGLGVNTSTSGAGYYTFDVSKNGVNELFIEDLQKPGELHNLLTSSFEVYLESGIDYSDRFLLHFGNNEEIKLPATTSVICVDNSLIFENVKGNYQVFDLTGKLVKRGVVSSTKEKLDLQKGNYIVNASGVTSKITIK